MWCHATCRKIHEIICLKLTTAKLQTSWIAVLSEVQIYCSAISADLHEIMHFCNSHEPPRNHIKNACYHCSITSCYMSYFWVSLWFRYGANIEMRPGTVYCQSLEFLFNQAPINDSPVYDKSKLLISVWLVIIVCHLIQVLTDQWQNFLQIFLVPCTAMALCVSSWTGCLFLGILR